jgi:hypothetical protein
MLSKIIFLRMGGSLSKESKLIKLPKTKKYLISYVKLENIPKQNEYDNKNEINLSNVFTDLGPSKYSVKLIYGALIYKLKMIGFWIIPNIPDFDFNKESPLNIILENIKNGFLLSDYSDLLDVEIKTNGYYATIENIRYLLNNGNILVAGIILDNELINNLTNENESNETVSDIILILGYNPTGLIIRTTWFNEQKNIILDYNFIDNIKEVWNITISNSFGNKKKINNNSN